MKLLHDIACITSYFPALSLNQLQRFSALEQHYLLWNARVNLISRKDIGNLYLRHVLHSLSIAKVVAFQSDAHIIDVGTGGGFPGIPLAILFPATHFTLVDSIGKKIKAVQAIAAVLGLDNVTTQTIRAEEITGKYDFAIARAVTSLPKLYGWVADKLHARQRHTINNGILYLQGTSVTEEVLNMPIQHNIYPIAQFFKELFFESKAVVHLFSASKVHER